MSKIYAVRQYFYGDEDPVDDGIVATFCSREEAQARADFEIKEAMQEWGERYYFDFVVEEQDE